MIGLGGLRVAVTRPGDEDEDRLASLLVEAGAVPLSVPTVQVSPPLDAGPLRRAASHALDYDWIVFTSRRAVPRFMSALAEAGVPVERFREAKVRICGVGSATGEAIIAAGLSPDLLPDRFVAEALAEAIVRGAGGAEGLSGARVLIPRAEEGRDAVPERLRREGARVDLVAAYRTVADREGAQRLSGMLEAGEVDAVTFTSGSAVASFARGRRSMGKKRRPLPPTVGVIAIGPVTADVLREEGLPVDEVAHPHTLEGVIQALRLWAARREGVGGSSIP